MAQKAWTNEVSIDLNGDAAKSLKARVVPKDDPTEIRLTGNCPRCGHEMLFVYPLVLAVPWGDTDKVGDLTLDTFRLPPPPRGLKKGSRDVSAYCKCATEHPKTPEGKAGCGARFQVHVRWGQ